MPTRKPSKPLKPKPLSWLKPKRAEHRNETVTALVSKLVRVQMMTPLLPEAIATRMSARNETANAIIGKVSSVNKRANALVLEIENRLLKLGVPPEEIKQKKAVLQELYTLQKKYGRMAPKEIPQADWNRMLALAKHFNEWITRTNPRARG